jgi:hypothetical protein
MGPGLFVTAGEWAGCLSCAVTAISGYAGMARVKGGWREAPAWTAPLVFTSAAVMFLVVFGTLALVPWLVLALIPLAVVAARSARAWAEIAKLQGRGAATAAVLGLLAARLRSALWNAREDLRDLGGLLRRTPSGDAAAVPPAGGAPYSPAATPAAMNALRAVPSVLEDRNLGSAPAPAEVGAELSAIGAPVPPVFRALAEWIAEAEFGSQDELEEHAAGEAAGWLAVADAKGQQAETLLTAPKLHPEYVAGQLEISDSIADLASLTTMGHRRYNDVYGDIIEWHEQDGNELPENARGWNFGGGGAPAA